MPDTQTWKNLEDLYKVLYLLPLIKIFLKNILFLCLVMWVMYVYSGAQVPMEAIDSLKLELEVLWATPQGKWELNWGPRQEQQVFVTAERQDT